MVSTSFRQKNWEPAAIRLTDLVVGCGVHRLGNEWDVMTMEVNCLNGSFNGMNTYQIFSFNMTFSMQSTALKLLV